MSSQNNDNIVLLDDEDLQNEVDRFDRYSFQCESVPYRENDVGTMWLPFAKAFSTMKTLKSEGGVERLQYLGMILSDNKKFNENRSYLNTSLKQTLNAFQTDNEEDYIEVLSTANAHINDKENRPLQEVLVSTTGNGAGATVTFGSEEVDEKAVMSNFNRLERSLKDEFYSDQELPVEEFLDKFVDLLSTLWTAYLDLRNLRSTEQKTTNKKYFAGVLLTNALQKKTKANVERGINSFVNGNVFGGLNEDETQFWIHVLQFFGYNVTQKKKSNFPSSAASSPAKSDTSLLKEGSTSSTVTDLTGESSSVIGGDLIEEGDDYTGEDTSGYFYSDPTLQRGVARYDVEQALGKKLVENFDANGFPFMVTSKRFGKKTIPPEYVVFTNTSSLHPRFSWSKLYTLELIKKMLEFSSFFENDITYKSLINWRQKHLTKGHETLVGDLDGVHGWFVYCRNLFAVSPDITRFTKTLNSASMFDDLTKQYFERETDDFLSQDFDIGRKYYKTINQIFDLGPEIELNEHTLRDYVTDTFAIRLTFILNWAFNSAPSRDDVLQDKDNEDLQKQLYKEMETSILINILELLDFAFGSTISFWRDQYVVNLITDEYSLSSRLVKRQNPNRFICPCCTEELIEDKDNYKDKECSMCTMSESISPGETFYFCGSVNCFVRSAKFSFCSCHAVPNQILRSQIQERSNTNGTDELKLPDNFFKNDDVKSKFACIMGSMDSFVAFDFENTSAETFFAILKNGWQPVKVDELTDETKDKFKKFLEQHPNVTWVFDITSEKYQKVIDIGCWSKPTEKRTEEKRVSFVDFSNKIEDNDNDSLNVVPFFNFEEKSWWSSLQHCLQIVTTKRFLYDETRSEAKNIFTKLFLLNEYLDVDKTLAESLPKCLALAMPENVQQPATP